MFFDGFVARWTFALKKQENSMFLTTFYAKIKKTKWFCLLFSAPIDDLARLTELLVDRRNNLKK